MANNTATKKPLTVPAREQHTALAARFENPIIKVSIKSGVISNRLENFWLEQSIKIRKFAS